MKDEKRLLELKCNNLEKLLAKEESEKNTWLEKCIQQEETIKSLETTIKTILGLTKGNNNNG